MMTTSTVESGMHQVIIQRQKKNGDIVYGLYLLDLWCLGLKDTMYKISSKWEFDEMYNQFSSEIELKEIDPMYAFNLIYGALEFGEDNGFKPPKDFSITEYILPHVESVEYMEIEFGVNGKPLYKLGPYDEPIKIFKTLEKTLGKGNFDYDLATDFYEDMSYDPSWEEDVIDIEDAILESRFYQISLPLVFHIIDLYDYDYSKLREDYNNDEAHTKLLKHLANNEFLRAFPEEEVVPLLKPTIENILIHENEDYLLEDIHLYSFAEDIDEEFHIFNSLTNVSLVQFGSKKLEVICNTILGLSYEGELEKAQPFLEELIRKYSSDKIAYVKAVSNLSKRDEVTLGITLLVRHINKIGPIKFDELTLKKL